MPAPFSGPRGGWRFPMSEVPLYFLPASSGGVTRQRCTPIHPGPFRCRAHTYKSHGLGLQVKVLTALHVVPSSLGSGPHSHTRTRTEAHRQTFTHTHTRTHTRARAHTHTHTHVVRTTRPPAPPSPAPTRAGAGPPQVIPPPPLPSNFLLG